MILVYIWLCSIVKLINGEISGKEVGIYIRVSRDDNFGMVNKVF